MPVSRVGAEKSSSGICVEARADGSCLGQRQSNVLSENPVRHSGTELEQPVGTRVWISRKTRAGIITLKGYLKCEAGKKLLKE